MRRSTAVSLAFIVAALVSAASAKAQSQVAPGTIADNDSIFIDGTTFKIIPGKAKNDSSSVIKTLGARELGPGAIVFRSGEKLYIVDVPLRLPADRQNVFVDADRWQTNRIRIEYVPPKNPEHQNVYDILKAHAALETVQKLFSPFRLPTEVAVKTVGCDGMANAWYEIQDARPTVTVCYEYLQIILQHAPKEPTPVGTTRADAIVGQMLFLVAHELGHAVFELLNIPIFGREEDAADQVAAYFMLQLGKERARGMIGGAAYAYMGYMKNYKENLKVAIPLEAFSSNHGSPRSASNLLCIAFGADPSFSDIVEQGYLPKTTVEAAGTYRTLAKALRREMSPHVDRQMANDIWESNWLPESTLRALAN